MNILDTKIEVILGDITDIEVDAIVNAANNTLLGGGGVDGAIHRVGGPEILEQCKKIGGCPTGEARITVGGKLPASYVIHTVGPIYKEEDKNIEQLLYNAYYNSLSLAVEYGLKTIAFPSISTGAYRYPIDEAIEIVYRAISDFISNKGEIETIKFILFSEKDYNKYKEFFKEKLA